MNIKWLKIETDFFHSREARMMKRNNDNWRTIFCIYFQLLTLAGECNKSGALLDDKGEPYDVKAMSDLIELDQEEEMDTALKLLEKHGYIEVMEGAYCIGDWGNKQNEDKLEEIKEKSRISSKKYRDKTRAMIINKGDVTVTSRDALEEEEELDEDKEQEGDANKKGSAPTSSLNSKSADLKSFLDTKHSTIQGLIREHGLSYSVPIVIEKFSSYWERTNKTFEGKKSHKGALSSLSKWLAVEAKDSSNLDYSGDQFDEAREAVEMWKAITYKKIPLDLENEFIQDAKKILDKGVSSEDLLGHLAKIKSLGDPWRDTSGKAFKEFEKLRAFEFAEVNN